CRLAAEARRAAARRRAREQEAARARTPEEPGPGLRELCAALDEELHRLPDRYRAPLVLCHLEGRTRDQAARELGCSVRTLDRRLARGRDLLRARLLGRGLTLSAALLAAGLSRSAANASGRAEATAAAARDFVCGRGSGSAAALAEAALRGLSLA